MSIIDEFFADVDQQWPAAPAATKIRLAIIGSSALMLQTRYERGTKDSDVFETVDLAPATKAALLRVAGKDTELHRRWRLYIDIVGNGIPFLPHGPLWHPVAAVNGKLRRIELVALDVVDVVVSKLKRFHANDQADVDAMIARGLVPHARLVARFRSAVDDFIGDARAAELPGYIANLHRVERDMLGVGETEIELPSWI